MWLPAVVVAGLVCGVWAGLPVPLAGQSAPAWSRVDSRRLLDKVGQIERNGAAATPAPLRTALTENEINAYLAYDGRDQIPAGVVDPRVRILEDRRVSARAVVDLDAVARQHKSTGWLDPMRFLTGRLVISAAGVLTATGGVARVEYERADAAGIPIPKALLQEILTYDSRPEANPRGLSLDDTYLLPARIRAIELGRSEAIIVQ